MVFKNKEDMNEGDKVAGVCYAAAAEDRIVQAFANLTHYYDFDQPTVIGYLVNDDRMNDCSDESCDEHGLFLEREIYQVRKRMRK